MGPIQIKCSCGEKNCQEWAVIELQGVIEAQPEFQNCLQNLEIGQLCRPSSQVLFQHILVFLANDMTFSLFFLVFTSKND